MNYFEEDKADKLKRLRLLRILHCLGAVRWKNVKGYAHQQLRIANPITWPYILIMVMVSVFAQGVPETIKEIKSFWRDDATWW